MTFGKELNQIITDGGMGDMICELVAADFNLRKHRHIQWHTWVQDYLLEFARHVLPPLSDIRKFSDLESQFNKQVMGVSTQWRPPHTAMRTHPVDYGFHVLCDRHIYRRNDKKYLSIGDGVPIEKFHLPKYYVCISAAATHPVKTMPLETMTAIVHWLIGRGYTPVFLGKESNDCGIDGKSISAKHYVLDYPGCIDLTNQTSLLESASIIAQSACMIGMDGGLIHLAGCTDVPIVAGYTLVDPIHVAPIRSEDPNWRFRAVEPDPLTPNRYYQTYYSGFKNEDVQYFPGWRHSVASMTPEKFIRAIDEVLARQ